MNPIIEYNGEHTSVPIIDDKLVYTFTVTTKNPPKILSIDECEGDTQLENIRVAYGGVARPQKDLDGNTYAHNINQLENKTYTSTIRKAV